MARCDDYWPYCGALHPRRALYYCGDGGEKVWLSAVLKPVEKRIYRVLGYQDTPAEMSGRQFVLAIVVFSLMSLFVVMGVLMT